MSTPELGMFLIDSSTESTTSYRNAFHTTAELSSRRANHGRKARVRRRAEGESASSGDAPPRRQPAAKH